MDIKERFRIIDHMFEKNDPRYNLTKAAEELQELALVLLQRAHKGLKVPDKAITDEIGDVKLRLLVIEKMFSREDVLNRINKKLFQYQNFIDTTKHKNI
jgi:hypothetical protein